MCRWNVYRWFCDDCSKPHTARNLEACDDYFHAIMVDQGISNDDDTAKLAVAYQAVEDARTASDSALRALHSADRLEVAGFELDKMRKTADAALFTYFGAQDVCSALQRLQAATEAVVMAGADAREHPARPKRISTDVAERSAQAAEACKEACREHDITLIRFGDAQRLLTSLR